MILNILPCYGDYGIDGWRIPFCFFGLFGGGTFHMLMLVPWFSCPGSVKSSGF